MTARHTYNATPCHACWPLPVRLHLPPSPPVHVGPCTLRPDETNGREFKAPVTDRVAPVIEAAQRIVVRAMELARAVDELDARGERLAKLANPLALYRHERDTLLVALFRREESEQ